MSRHNYMRKRNRQLYCSSMESQTVLLDPRRYTMVRQDALRWNWMSQAKMRASASLRQFWLTHADALHFQIQCSDSSGCNTRIKVKHQITKLLTKVLTHADALRWDRMHYGETECLKQRCVHQQVSDSSGWLMLMHFIFKFNWHQWLPTTAVDLYLGTSTDTTLGPASLWTQQVFPHCITSGVEDIPNTADWDLSLDERKTMPFMKRVN